MVALLKNKPLLASDEIRALAKANGVTADKTNMDFMSDKFAELSGDSPVDHEIDQLCVNLVRAGVISEQQSMALLIRHLKSE